MKEASVEESEEKEEFDWQPAFDSGGPHSCRTRKSPARRRQGTVTEEGAFYKYFHALWHFETV